MAVAEPLQCAVHSRFCFAAASPEAHNVIDLGKLSSRIRSFALGLSPSTARDQARSHFSAVIDVCAVDFVAMRSQSALSRAAHSCRESDVQFDRDVRMAVAGFSQENPPTALVSSRFASIAELQSQVAVSHTTRCSSSATNLMLHSSINRLVCVFFQSRFLRAFSQSALCC